MAYDLVGQVFGRLTVTKFAGVLGKYRVRSWECQCACGNIHIASTSSLRDGSVSSCGCLYKESRHTIKNAKDSGVAMFNRIYDDYKNRAKKLSIAFTITADEFRVLTQQNCHYCGVAPMQYRKNGKKRYNGVYLYNGLDRVDNAQGYTTDNVVACCGICNKAKRDLTLEDFNIWIQRLVSFQTRKLS